MSTDTNHNATQAVFELVLARPVAQPGLHHGKLIHLMWRAPDQGDRLVQVYLNGQLSGASQSITQREAWLVVDHDRHIQIELLAVSAPWAWTDQSDCLAGPDPNTQTAASLVIARDLSLPSDASLEVRVDGGVEVERIALFSPKDARGGFGAVFGDGGFGYDTATGPGLGRGELGYGPLGSDGDALRWRNDTLPTDTHTIDLTLTDHAGLAASQSLSLDLTIDRLPPPPGNVQLNNELQLTWT